MKISQYGEEPTTVVNCTLDERNRAKFGVQGDYLTTRAKIFHRRSYPTHES